jgi:uncharacterized protein YdcH (DUF465 family)
MSSVIDVHERLVREDPHFRHLVERHQEFERRLADLQGRRWLSDDERLEEVRLKKRKLALKDEMQAILRRREQQR